MNKSTINILLAIEMENIYSIKNRVRLDFRAANMNSAQTKLLTSNVFEWNGQKILKTIGLFGPNAAGKSNIIKAIYFFCRTVLDSHQYNVNKKFFDFIPFKFEGYENKPSRFFINFVTNGVEYEYEYTITRESILSESLYYYPNHRKAKIFEKKEGKPYTFGTKVLLRPKEVADSLTPKNLYLSRAAAMNREMAQTVYHFFMHEFMLDLFPLNSELLRANFMEYKPLILKAMHICDSDIQDIIMKRRTSLQPVQAIQSNGELSLEIRPVEVLQFKTTHKQDPKVQFDMDEEESEGTKRLFNIVTRLIDVIRHGKSLMLDEFDRQLHTHLADFIIDLVHATPTSQFLFTSHNTNLMDMGRFRRDQVVYVNKCADGSTEVYSLADFKDFRETMDAEKGYLQGRFDAIPYVQSSPGVLKSFLKDDINE